MVLNHCIFFLRESGMGHSIDAIICHVNGHEGQLETTSWPRATPEKVNYLLSS